MFGISYSRNKDLVKKDTGDIFRRQPAEYKSVLILMSPLRMKSGKKNWESCLVTLSYRLPTGYYQSQV